MLRRLWNWLFEVPKWEIYQIGRWQATRDGKVVASGPRFILQDQHGNIKAVDL